MKKLLGILGAVGLVSSTSSIATACNTKNNNNNEKTEMTLDEMVKKYSSKLKEAKELINNLPNGQDPDWNKYWPIMIDVLVLSYEIYNKANTTAELNGDYLCKTKEELVQNLRSNLEESNGSINEDTKKYFEKYINLYSN